MPGVQVSYRFHLTDPVRFRERILVSMERGHANHLADDWSSTAYWYQRLPSPPASLLPVTERLPVRIGTVPGTQTPNDAALAGVAPDRAAARASAAARLAQAVAERDARLAGLAATTRAAEQASRAEVLDLRARTLG